MGWYMPERYLYQWQADLAKAIERNDVEVKLLDGKIKEIELYISSNGNAKGHAAKRIVDYKKDLDGLQPQLRRKLHRQKQLALELDPTKDDVMQVYFTSSENGFNPELWIKLYEAEIDSIKSHKQENQNLSNFEPRWRDWHGHKVQMMMDRYEDDMQHALKSQIKKKENPLAYVEVDKSAPQDQSIQSPTETKQKEDNGWETNPNDTLPSVPEDSEKETLSDHQNQSDEDEERRIKGEDNFRKVAKDFRQCWLIRSYQTFKALSNSKYYEVTKWLENDKPEKFREWLQLLMKKQIEQEEKRRQRKEDDRRYKQKLERDAKVYRRQQQSNAPDAKNHENSTRSWKSYDNVDAKQAPAAKNHENATRPWKSYDDVHAQKAIQNIFTRPSNNDEFMDQLQQLHEKMLSGPNSWMHSQVLQMKNNYEAWHDYAWDIDYPKTWLVVFVTKQVNLAMNHYMQELQSTSSPNLLWQTQKLRSLRGEKMTDTIYPRQKKFEQKWQTIQRICCQCYCSHWRRLTNNFIWSQLPGEGDQEKRNELRHHYGLQKIDFTPFQKDIETAAECHFYGAQYKVPKKIQDYIHKTYPGEESRAYAAWHTIVRHWKPRNTKVKNPTYAQITAGVKEKRVLKPREIPFIMNASFAQQDWIV